MVISSAVAVEVPLRAFDASYKLYEGGLHIANTRISLQQQDELWQWRTSIKARGMFAWFTKRKPFTETSFSQDADSTRLHRVIVNTGSRKYKPESARFDWENGTINVLRKNKKSQLMLESEIYDYQSIHVLATKMIQQGLQKKSIVFYRKGKLVKSQLMAEERKEIDVNGNIFDAYLFVQIIPKYESTLHYYYDAKNTILPLRIETIEAGDRPSIMILNKVDWNL